MFIIKNNHSAKNIKNAHFHKHAFSIMKNLSNFVNESLYYIIER